MARPRKDSEQLHCRLERDINNGLEALCKETGLAKTVAVERALERYIRNYKKTGRA